MMVKLVRRFYFLSQECICFFRFLILPQNKDVQGKTNLGYQQVSAKSQKEYHITITKISFYDGYDGVGESIKIVQYSIIIYHNVSYENNQT